MSTNILVAVLVIGGGLAIYNNQNKLLNSFPIQSSTSGSGTQSSMQIPTNPIYVGPSKSTQIYIDPSTGVITDWSHPGVVIIPDNQGKVGSQM